MLPVIGQSQGDHSPATWGTAASLTFVQLVRQNCDILKHPTFAIYSVQFLSPRSESNVTRNHSHLQNSTQLTGARGGAVG
jgi:hypothetical protein